MMSLSSQNVENGKLPRKLSVNPIKKFNYESAGVWGCAVCGWTTEAELKQRIERKKLEHKSLLFFYGS